MNVRERSIVCRFRKVYWMVLVLIDLRGPPFPISYLKAIWLTVSYSFSVLCTLLTSEGNSCWLVCGGNSIYLEIQKQLLCLWANFFFKSYKCYDGLLFVHIFRVCRTFEMWLILGTTLLQTQQPKCHYNLL